MFLNDSIMDDIQIAKMGLTPKVSSVNNNSATGIGAALNVTNKTSNELLNTQESKQLAQQGLLTLMLTSSQHNNIFMAILFYFIGMAYWNPYYSEKCSRNRICKKKKK